MRRISYALAVALFAAACSDRAPVPPNSDFGPPPVASAISDGANGGNENIFFLAPLVKGGTPTGTFNPFLAPEIEVCLLEGTDCGADPTVVAYFGPGEAQASDTEYQLNWDTNAPDQNLAPMDETEDYRVRVKVGDLILGYFDVDPQDPDGTTPSLQREGFYTFRLGETLPIKFWLSQGVICDTGDPDVIECIEGTIFDAEGGTLTLEDLGPALGVTVPPDGLPDTDPVVTFRLERRDLGPGEECIVGLDAPTFGPCFRIVTIPATFQEPLEFPSVVSICIDPLAFVPELALPSQWEHFQLFRQPESLGPIQGLANVPSTVCPEPVGTAGDGLLARILRPVARVLGPRPLSAIHRGRGGEVEEVLEFSFYQWALPAKLFATAGDDQIGNAGAAVAVAPQVRALDELGDPVQNARVHFTVTDGNGNVTPATGFTGADGYVAVDSWVLGDQGDNALEASGLGLFGENDEFIPHDFAFDAATGTVTFSATAAGPPASVVPTDPDQGSAEVNSLLPVPLEVTVLDDGTNSVTALGVPGVTVTWTVTAGNGFLIDDQGSQVTTLTTVTGSDGKSTVVFQLGTQAGTNEVSAVVGSLAPAVFTAQGLPGAPAEILKLTGDGQTAYVGQTLPTALSVQVEDTYDNVIGDAVVTWSVVSGGGSITPDASDPNSATWTLGSLPGTNTARASLDGLTADFTATAECFTGWGTATIDGTLGDEWTCAVVEDFTANLGNGGVPAKLYRMNDGQNMYLAVRVEGADKVNALRFDFDNDNDGVPELGDDGLNYDPSTGLYTDEYLTEKCTNSSQAGCGNQDPGAPDGAGAFTNVGGVTIYEISKPLDSADDAHDFSLTAGDTVGMFWTLRLGNGAKGNTQVPGFRVWRDFLIVGF